MKKRIFWLSGLLGLLSACDLVEHRQFHDPALKLQKQDYENITKAPEVQKAIPPFCPKTPLPPLLPVLTPSMAKPVSLSVYENISLKEVLMELGYQAGVGVALSPQLGSEKVGIIYSVTHTSFIEVIKDICSLTHLRFQIQGNRILIEPDLPYLKTYSVQFLSHTRKSENRIAVSTDVFTPLESQARTDNGSASVLLGNSLMDFWVELEHNLKMILSAEAKGAASYSLHKQAGLVTVHGTARQQEQVAQYLQKLKEATSSQVIIEAKIIEVALDNEFKTGINWEQLARC